MTIASAKAYITPSLSKTRLEQSLLVYDENQNSETLGVFDGSGTLHALQTFGISGVQVASVSAYFGSLDGPTGLQFASVGAYLGTYILGIQTAQVTSYAVVGPPLSSTLLAGAKKYVVTRDPVDLPRIRLAKSNVYAVTEVDITGNAYLDTAGPIYRQGNNVPYIELNGGAFYVLIYLEGTYSVIIIDKDEEVHAFEYYFDQGKNILPLTGYDFNQVAVIRSPLNEFLFSSVKKAMLDRTVDSSTVF